ncbi:MAG: hypothetical protein ACYCPR_05275 [Thermoplasmataceae archaeon]
MTTYEGNLLNALENILYRDRSRQTLKSSDLDVLSLLSGDEEAVIYYLKQFHLKHPDKSTVIHTGKCLEVKVFDLFPVPEQTNQKINWKKNHRFKEGKWSVNRQSRRDAQWKR